MEKEIQNHFQARYERLSDGQEVLLRPICIGDEEIEADFVRDLSPQSRYYRFLNAKRELSPKMVKHFTHVDFSKDMAIIALTKKRPGTKEKEVAVARYYKIKNEPKCEFAIVVDDRYQGLGLGKKMMRVLIEDAKSKGHFQMEGLISRENQKMLKFVKGLGFRTRTCPSDSKLILAELDLRPASLANDLQL